jgi:multiple sugar transport system permease protein
MNAVTVDRGRTSRSSLEGRAGGSTPSTRRGQRVRRRREAVAAYGFLAPNMVGLSLFLGLPMVLAFVISFFDASGFGGYRYVGFDNYQRMLGDGLLAQSAQVSLVYVIAFVPLVYVAGLALALLVQDAFPGVGFARTAFFVPHVISLVIVGLLWQFLLVERRGLISTLARPLGLGDVSWLGDPRYALPTLIAISVWFYMGYFMIILLSGLKDIPKEYYDAARVDGASSWQRFRYITWPLLKPTSFFVVVVATVNAAAGLQAFDLVYVTTAGGPANSTSTVVFYVYQQAFQYNDLGYASAITALLALFLMVVTGLMFAITRGGRFDVG